MKVCVSERGENVSRSLPVFSGFGQQIPGSLVFLNGPDKIAPVAESVAALAQGYNVRVDVVRKLINQNYAGGSPGQALPIACQKPVRIGGLSGCESFSSGLSVQYSGSEGWPVPERESKMAKPAGRLVGPESDRGWSAACTAHEKTFPSFVPLPECIGPAKTPQFSTRGSTTGADHLLDGRWDMDPAAHHHRKPILCGGSAGAHPFPGGNAACEATRIRWRLWSDSSERLAKTRLRWPGSTPVSLQNR